MCELAIQENPYAFEYIDFNIQHDFDEEKDKYELEEMCKFAIKNHYWYFKYIPEDLQTEEICKIAVQERGYLLKYVKNQTEEICKLAVQEWEGALEYVKDEYNPIMGV